MSLPSLLPWAVAAWLLGVGLFGIVTSRNFVHLIGCLSVVQSSTYVLLLSVGLRAGGIAPIFYTYPPGTAAGPASTQPAPVAVLAWLSVASALLLAAYQLSRHHLCRDC